MKSAGIAEIILLLAGLTVCYGEEPGKSNIKLVPVAEGWAGNSVNTTIFRRNSLVTEGDTQFIAFYDSVGRLCLGKRNIDSDQWTLHTTQYEGNVRDAHNSISIMSDDEGYLHVSWDHHGHPLRYAVGTEPYGLELGDKRVMTGAGETKVTYPEFLRMPDGDLLFVYRDGGSGSGNLGLKRYNCQKRVWSDINLNLIDGQGQRNAYW